MKRIFYGRLITQPLIFFLMLGATHKISFAKSSLCTQTSIIESFVEDISGHIGGCTVCDTLAIIDSKIDALNPFTLCDVCADLSIIDSKIDALNPFTLCDVCADLSIIDSKIDALSPSSCNVSVIDSIVDSISNKIGGCTVCDQLTIIENDLTTITNDLSVIDSKIDALSPSSCDVSVIDSIVDSISNKIGGCTVCDQLTIIENDLTTITNDLSVIDSKIDALSPSSCNVSAIESIVDSISNKIGGCTVCDQLTIIENDLTTITNDLSVIDSKIDALSPSSCDVSAIESIVDSISNKIGGCTVCDQLTIIENDLTTITNDLSVIDSKIDALSPSSCNVSAIESIVDSISNKIGGCTVCDQLTIIENDLTTITNDLSVIDSKIDALSPSSCNVSVIESIVDSISNKIGGCTVCDQLTIIENDLTTITNDLSVIDSKIDALSPASCDVSVIDSIVDSISNKIGGCTVCDQLTIIESDLSVIDSKIDALSPSSCDLSVIESVVDSISNKIGGCTVCDQLLVIETNLTTIENDLSVIDSKIDSLESPCDPTIITGSVTITQPGNYCVANSFSGSIIIEIGDVYLDLNERTIANAEGAAIEVMPQLNQVTITNGFVTGSTAGIVVDHDCAIITISNVSAFYCGNQGIWINDGVYASKIVDCEMLSCVTGLQIDGSTKISVSNCITQDNAQTGIALNSSTKINIKDCIAQDNAQAGIALSDSSDCRVIECKVVGNGTGTSGVVTYGIVSDSGSCNIFEKCIVLDTEIIGTFTCPPACFVPYMDPLVVQDCTISVTTATYGIALLNNEQNSKVIDCEVGCTQASGLIDCGCDRVLSPNPTQSFGIALGATVSNPSPALSLVASNTLTAIDVGWLVCGGENFLAVSDTTDSLINIFDFNGNTLNLIASANPALGFEPGNLAWVVDNSTKYLAFAGLGSGNSFEVYKFDTGTTSLTFVASSTFLIPASPIAWLVLNGCNKYIATNGFPDGEKIVISKFDITTTPTIQQIANFTTDEVISSLAWLIANNTPYLAAGGYNNGFGYAEVDIFSFNATASTLTQVATTTVSSTVDSDVNSVAWFVCDGNNYLALGINGDEPNGVQIFEFNSTTSSLTQVVTSTVAGTNVQSVAWFVCDGINYLATANGLAATVSIFEFNPTFSTLTLVSNATLVGNGDAVAWLVSDNIPYLAAAAGGAGTDVFSFNCNAAPASQENNIVQRNLVYNTDGIGIDGDGSTNLIVANVAYNNNINYGDEVGNIFSGGIGSTVPDPLLNRSL